MNKLQYFGVIGEQTKETDYQLGEELEIPRARMKFQDNKIQYNQKEVSAVSCTIHGAMGAYSDLTGYFFTLDERKELWKEALELGADPKVGWYTNLAVDLIRNHINKDTEKVSTFRVNIGSEQFFRALRLGYSVVISHRGNAAYNADKSDGILDGTAFGSTTYGHCLRMTYSVGDEYELIVNNYKGSDTNLYKVSSAHIKKLIENNVFFRDGYIFIEEFEQKVKIPVWATESWEKALKKGVIDEQDDPEQLVGSLLLEDTLIDAGVLSQSVGNISLVRWIVALDRMKQLD